MDLSLYVEATHCHDNLCITISQLDNYSDSIDPSCNRDEEFDQNNFKT